MRWEELFGDLAAQFDAAEAADVEAEVADRGRREVGVLHFADRVRPAVGQRLHVRVLGAGNLDGRLASAGPDWLLMHDGAGRETVVVAAAVASIGGLGAQSDVAARAGRVAARLTLTYVLRTITRDRSAVVLTLRDGSCLAGTLDRVGADFLEIAEHAPGEVRRRDAVLGVRTVPLTALALVRRS